MGNNADLVVGVFEAYPLRVQNTVIDRDIAPGASIAAETAKAEGKVVVGLAPGHAEGGRNAHAAVTTATADALCINPVGKVTEGLERTAVSHIDAAAIATAAAETADRGRHLFRFLT